MADLKVGDVVELKSGGPSMTVVAIGKSLHLAWFDSKDELQSSAGIHFSEMTLNTVVSEEEKEFELKSGDNVQLKSGGKLMVVNRFDEKDTDKTYCLFHDIDGALVEKSFPAMALKKERAPEAFGVIVW